MLNLAPITTVRLYTLATATTEMDRVLHGFIMLSMAFSTPRHMAAYVG